MNTKKDLILGIDAHNLRAGGGITHVINLLIQPEFYQGFKKIYFFGGANILNQLMMIKPQIMPNVEIMHQPYLDKSLFHRIFWQQHMLPKMLNKLKVDILFSPGGILPFCINKSIITITMCHNMLPINLKETLHLGLDLRFIRFLILRHLQLSSYRRADGVIFISHYAKNEVSKLVPTLTNHQGIIYHGINPKFFTDKPKSSKTKPIKILYVSTVDVYKHQWNVVKAVHSLKQKGYDQVYLNLIGWGYPPAVKLLKKTISELKMESYVEWKGHVDYHKLADEYHESSLFVFASSCENCPNILLEAMASRLPIACSESQPMPEFTSADSVRYFDPEDPESIADSIAFLVDNPEKALSFSEKAFEMAQKYTWQTCAKETYEFILATIEEKSPALSLIGPLPPPLIGQSLAFQMICDEVQTSNLNHEVIDIGGEQLERRDGSFSLNRIHSLIKPLFNASSLPFKKKRIIYLTIAQSWYGFLRDMVFILFSWLGKHKIILHLHGGNYDHFYKKRFWFTQKVIRFVLSKANKIIVLSKNLIPMFSFLPGYPEKVVVVPNGLPIDENLLVKKPKTLDLRKTIRILYLSNLIESKGYMDVLNAANILKTEFMLPLEVHFCGNFLLGSDSKNYDTSQEAQKDFFRQVAKLGLEKEINWKGSVQGADKIKELEEAHFFILPTYYNNEGQPISIIEAMAYGCCVITTQYRAIPDLIGEEEAGKFVPPKSPKAIAKVIHEICSNPGLYSSYSQKALTRYKNHFTKAVHLKRLKEVILN